MQVTETSSEGLKRSLRVVVEAAELGTRLTKRVDEVKGDVQFKGFRKGKVPTSHIRKVLGRNLMAEVLDQAIRETSAQAIADRKERAAAMPDIQLEEVGSIDNVIAGKTDLAYNMSFEVLPAIELTDFTKLKLEKLVADVDPESLDKALADLASRNTSYEAEDGRKAVMGDRVTINYEGSIDGQPFEGGKGEGLSLVLGNANFIPGFEEGLIGAKVDERRDVKGTFPENYPVADLASKPAVFDVTVTKVEKPVMPEIDEDFAKGLGVENLEKLREVVSRQLSGELDGVARMKMKRELLDQLEKLHDFELPPSLVTREFEGIWNQLTRTLENQGKTLADEEKSEDELRAEYQRIAARRVRLGLVIGEIGAKNNIQVSQDELRRALFEQARRYPGQEKFVYEYFEKTPGAIADLRAPIFEDKVVDHIFGTAKVSEKKVSRDELMKEAEAAAQS